MPSGKPAQTAQVEPHWTDRTGSNRFGWGPTPARTAPTPSPSLPGGAGTPGQSPACFPGSGNTRCRWQRTACLHQRRWKRRADTHKRSWKHPAGTRESRCQQPPGTHERPRNQRADSREPRWSTNGSCPAARRDARTCWPTARKNEQPRPKPRLSLCQGTVGKACRHPSPDGDPAEKLGETRQC